MYLWFHFPLILVYRQLNAFISKQIMIGRHPENVKLTVNGSSGRFTSLVPTHAMLFWSPKNLRFATRDAMRDLRKTSLLTVN